MPSLFDSESQLMFYFLFAHRCLLKEKTKPLSRNSGLKTKNDAVISFWEQIHLYKINLRWQQEWWAKEMEREKKKCKGLICVSRLTCVHVSQSWSCCKRGCPLQKLHMTGVCSSPGREEGHTLAARWCQWWSEPWRKLSPRTLWSWHSSGLWLAYIWSLLNTCYPTYTINLTD